MANWIETKVRYEKTLENGTKKMVSETYLVDALIFSEAEARITKEIAPCLHGDFSVSEMKRANITEILFSEKDSADKYYEIKTVVVVFNTKTLVERRYDYTYLVQAKRLNDALIVFDDYMKKTLSADEIVSVSKTAIVDVFTYKPAEK